MNQSNDSSFDSDVEWLSAESREKSRHLLPILLVVGGIMLSMFTLIAFCWFVVRRAWLKDENVVVTRLQSTAHLQAESVQAFGGFNSSPDCLPGIPREKAEERQAIESLLDKIQESSAAEDSEQFRKYVDHHKLLKRIELGGYLAGYSLIEKRYLRTQLKQSVYVDTYWTELNVALVKTPRDDPDSRILFAFGTIPDTNSHAELRLIIGRDGDSWKLYDWQRLDQGLNCSEEWGIYAKHYGTDLYEGFSRWSDLIDESNQFISAGDYEGAAEKLRQAESQPIPPEMKGFCWLTNGYFWQAAGEQDEAIRCFRQVPQPKKTPGAYFGLMNSYRWKDPVQAIEFGNEYEQCVGPTIELCETKAQLYQRLSQKDDALAEWEKLLRIDPDHANALQSVIVALPAKEKSRFDSFLARQDDPTKTAASVAQAVAWQDPNAIKYLKTYLLKNAPGTAASHYVAGLAERSVGRLQQAAEAFHRAFLAEQDEHTRNGYFEDYQSAMSAIGRGVEAWKQAPDKQALFDSLVYEYDDGVSQLSNEELEQLASELISEHPTSLAGYHFLANLANQAAHYEQAEEFLRQGLAQPSESDPNEHALYDSETLNYLLANVLYKLGRLEAAYNLTDERKDRFAQLCHLATEAGNWDVVQSFLDMHREYQSNDPQWHYYQAKLLAHKQEWNTAIEAFQRGRSLAEEDIRGSFDSQILELSIAAGNWAQHYASAKDQEYAFDYLAREFLAHKDWGSLQQLVIAHRIKHRFDPQIARHLANAAWEQGDYPTFVEHATHLLEGEDETLTYSYMKDIYKRRLQTALIHSGKHSRANQLAARREQKEHKADHLAIVAAATGNHRRAQQLALETARKDQTATTFYHSEAVGPVFLGEEYNELQQEFPVVLPYNFSKSIAVFLSETAWQLELEQIQAALDSHSVLGKKVDSLDSQRQDLSGSFVIQLDECGVWVATGSGSFEKSWRFEHETHPLLKSAHECQHWLAVGTFALSDIRHREAGHVARLVASELARGNSRLLCAEDSDSWRRFRIHPAHHDLVSRWMHTGTVLLAHGRGLSLDEWQEESSIVEDREHRLALTEVARKYESNAASQLEVVAYGIPQIKGGELRLHVSSVKHKYGGLQFEGELSEESKLFPLLRKGLCFRMHLNNVVGWQLDGHEPIYRED